MINFITTLPTVDWVAQSVQWLTTGWTVRDRIPVGTRFSAHPDRPWSPPSFLYNGYRVFPGVKVRPRRAADHSSPSSAAVMEEYSYTCTHPLGHTGLVTGSLYLFYYSIIYIFIFLAIYSLQIFDHKLYTFFFSPRRTTWHSCRILTTHRECANE